MRRWRGGAGYIERLGEIDTTGLPDQEKLSAELMMRSLIDDQEAAKFKEWEMPVNQFSGFHTDLALVPSDLQFDSVKDYDDYISRLQKVPKAFSQITANMQVGIDEGTDAACVSDGKGTGADADAGRSEAGGQPVCRCR